jgi:hypothetical protein
MQPLQKRCRQGDTTLTFFSVPQHTAHRVSCRTASNFIFGRIKPLDGTLSSRFYTRAQASSRYTKGGGFLSS